MVKIGGDPLWFIVIRIYQSMEPFGMGISGNQKPETPKKPTPT